jgi:hypothetical protein
MANLITNNEQVEMAIEDQNRLAKGKAAMDAVMKNFGLKLDVGLIIRPGKIDPLVRVVLDPNYVSFPASPFGHKNHG